MEGYGCFGDWLHQRRRVLDLTRIELAQCAGCSVSALRKIEAGERRPSKQLAGLLANCLGVPPDKHADFIRSARGELRVDRLGPPAPSAVPTPSHLVPTGNLPVPATRPIGRESELSALLQLLRDPHCRLLSVVGPGGVGKTRLAIEAAAMCRERFSDGVYFVSLSALSLPQFVAPAIADALGLAFYGAADQTVQLLNHMQDKTLLLLLDSAEHVLAGLKIVGELLQHAPGVKVLTTSRQRLDLQGEWIFEISGLPVPPEDQSDGLQGYSAVALFLDVAQRAGMIAAQGPEDWVAIGRICRLVDGMPLGIELAAAWVRVLSCREIADEIERNLDFLVTTRRDIPERHRSMRAVFDHSWNLLSDEERNVLRRLAVFKGGFRRQAGEQVAGASLPLLAALVDKSLLYRSQAGRYAQHELVRQYAWSRLNEVPAEYEAARDLHSAYYADFVRQLEQDLKGERQLQALSEISADIENIRLAWHWAVGRGHSAAVERPIRGLWVFHEIRGWFREAENALAWAANELDRTDATQTWGAADLVPLRDHIRAHQGWFCLKLGKLEEAAALLQPALASLRECGTNNQLVDALYFAGVLAWLTGDYVRARALLLEELAVAIRIGDQWGIGLAQGNLGLLAQTTGEYQEARARWQAALGIVRALGDNRMVAAALHFRGRLERTLGAYELARATLHESLALGRAVGDRWVEGLALGQLGYVAQALGNSAEAADWFRQSLALAREIAEGWSTLQALNGLGAASLSLGELEASRSAFCEALHMAWEMRALPEAVGALVGLADWLMRMGNLEEALAMVLLAEQHPAASQTDRDQAAWLRQELMLRLTPEQINVVQAQTQDRPFDVVVEELLDCSRQEPQQEAQPFETSTMLCCSVAVSPRPAAAGQGA